MRGPKDLFPIQEMLREWQPELYKATEAYTFKALALSGLNREENFLVMLATMVAMGQKETIKGCVLRAIEEGISIDKLRGSCIAVISIVGYPKVMQALDIMREIETRPVKITEAGKDTCMICN